MVWVAILKKLSKYVHLGLIKVQKVRSIFDSSKNVANLSTEHKIILKLLYWFYAQATDTAVFLEMSKVDRTFRKKATFSKTIVVCPISQDHLSFFCSTAPVYKCNGTTKFRPFTLFFKQSQDSRQKYLNIFLIF